MVRKIFISVLGYSNYGKCFYTRDGFKSDEVRYVQEATLEYLRSVSEWTAEDCAYILLTKGAEEKNWVDNGHCVYGTDTPIQQLGLASVLETRHYPFPVIPVKDIPDGNDEKEIWQIFDRVFSVIQEGDELYFDMTHGFRYLPMLILVLGNYSKLLKNVVVKSITYGNYEARDKNTNEAPLIDLQALSNLQDWTSASASFLKNGNLSMLKSLCQQNLNPVLKETKGTHQQAKALSQYMKALNAVVDDLNTCRGVCILNGKHIEQLFACSKQLSEVMIEPMKPIVEKLKGSFAKFVPSQNIKNGYFAAKWCFDNQLYQQSLTILHETIISHICEDEKLDFSVFKNREGAKNRIYAYIGAIKEKKQCDCIEEGSLLIKQLAPIFVSMTELRNDFNHSGMRLKPLERKSIVSNLEKRLDVILSMIENEEICS